MKTQMQKTRNRFWMIPSALLLILIITVGLIILGQQGMGFLAILATRTSTPTSTPTITPTSTQTPTPIPTGTPAPTQDTSITWMRPADGMIMVFVPAGSYRMGSTGFYANESPVHEVSLNAYWIDKTEVTNGMYARCVSDGNCQPPFKNSSFSHLNYYGDALYIDFPVIYVDWNQASAYCRWAGGRLPTEAEWERAARGTGWGFYPWGIAAPVCSLANFWFENDTCVGDTTAVGSYPSGASPVGALDMAGNVWEWVNDWYSETYYSQSPSSNPQGPASGTDRVLRGGAWDFNENYIRSSYRYNSRPSLSYNVVGFRCSRDDVP
jgi:formylglycine-generating enzyme required for sulfatase activity